MVKIRQNRAIRQGGVLSTFLYLVYIDDLLNDLERSGQGVKVMSVNAGNPTFADDISLIALTPFHLQKLLDIVECYCKQYQWKVSINVDNSSVTVFTKKQTQPVVAASYDGRVLSLTASLYTSVFSTRFIEQ